MRQEFLHRKGEVNLSIQKADMWKRMSAALFDVIMLCILVVGFSFIFSELVGYDKHIEALEKVYEKYEEKYGPLTIYGNYDLNCWHWIDSPWPWEKEEN